MPADPKELERRAGAATDADTSRGLNFNTLFTLVRETVGDPAAKACDPQGKGSRIDFFSYPVAEYLRIAWAAADRLEPRLGSVDAVWRELGRRTIANFLSSTIGRTVFAMAGRDPRKVVAAAPAGYRTAVSYGERKVQWLDERHARVVFRHDFMPAAFHAAVIQAGLEATDARAPAVTGRELAFLETEYDVRWE
ncbi:DUF2378 family protein [Anaeromyxobacter oryzae]|uniref:TIGR02265 family protein n=1 Tax=Anaeromyxobacter oryzae TaxID=2918170 RepID=A0ABN6MQH2_9BACT|nr:DUF2378 family protein [Anaeromyxobacter oryzae]BDG03248.1 hypothetical protein AMOR_22440 [Anaeromyxobacter oryzae]